MYTATPLVGRPPTVNIMRSLGLEPDPWQIEVLESQHPQMLLNCCRQAGKTTVVAILALVHAMFNRFGRVLIVSRSHRQSKEVLRTITFFHQLLGDRLLKRRTVEEIEFDHYSRIVSVPCKEETTRGYANISLLIVDEAARVPDDLYRSMRPILAVSNGRLICLSTPYGKRGFFWDAWAKGGDDWARIEIPASKCPRIKPEFLQQERRAMGDSWFQQEYFCSFEAMEGLVYPDFSRGLVDELPPHVKPFDQGWEIASLVSPQREQGSSVPVSETQGGSIKRVGGIDFGFRNPFAALWGIVDRDDILWLCGEHYLTEQPLSHHAQRIPKNVLWYADPEGAGDIAEMQRANFKVRKGNNSVRPGIMAVTARLRDGTLRVLKDRCPNLLAEAGRHRYDHRHGQSGSEIPLDDNNHALDALRYLISCLDERRMALIARGKPIAAEAPPKTPEQLAEEAKREEDRKWWAWVCSEDPRIWRPVVW